YPVISTGWHFNAADPKIAPGRPGEPWILTDSAIRVDPKEPAQSNTRTQIPLSYRDWPGVWRPADIGFSDWKFAFAFGSHLPGGDGPTEPPFEYDLGRFNRTGTILFNISRRVPNDRCYFCHTSLDNGKDQASGLAQRWRHDRDIHLVKGMLCVDCHRHGLDHA